MTLNTLRLIWLIATLALALPALAQNQPTKITPDSATLETPAPDQSNDVLPDDVDLRTGKLPNGLTYYIRKNHKPGNRVELRLAIKVGSILEDDDQRGLAHFVEHMMFDGTRHFPNHTLTAKLESLGVKFGADLNAFTSADDTIYILPLPLDHPENLEIGMQILEDWAQGALISDEGIEHERPVVLEELRGTKGAIERMSNATYAEQVNGSRYAQRRPIGLESVLTHFNADQARRFYHDWYRPDLEAIIVVGDIDPDQVQQMVVDHFSALTNPPAGQERERTHWSIAPRKKSTGLVVTDKESPYNILSIRYPVQPALPEVTVADYRRTLLRSLCIGMIEQRIYEMTELAEPPFITASFSVEQTALNTETVLMSAIIGHRGIAPALNALSGMANTIRRDGFSADELNRSKLNLQHYYDNQYAERYGTNSKSLADMYRRHFLFHASTMDIGYKYGLASELIPQITLQEVQTLARQIMPADAARLITYMGSTGENLPLPDGKKLLAMMNSADHAPIIAKHDELPLRPLPAMLMPEPPAGGTIVSKRTQEQLGLTEFTLSNGVKVLFKPTRFQQGQVLLSAARFGGQSLYDDADKFSAQYAAAIQASMGVGDFTPAEIRKITSGKSIQLQTGISLFSESVTGSANSADLELLLQWLYLSMTAPRRDEQLFHSFIGRYKDFARNALLRPETLFQEKIYEGLFNHHPRTPLPPSPGDFDQINLERAMAIYRERFGSADGLTFIITGDISADSVKSLASHYLGALPTAKINQHYRDLGIRPADARIDLDVNAGTDDKSQVVLLFNGPARYSLKEINEFYAAVDIIKERITHVLREQLSLTYNGTIAGNMERAPYGNYSISASLPCAPENVPQVIAALTKEIEDLKRDGPTQAELDTLKQIWIKNREVEKQSNQFWSGGLQSDVLYDSDPSTLLTYERRISTITVSEVQQAAVRYFDFNHLMQALLYPATQTDNKGK